MMKKYLLICLLIFSSLSKFRNLKNLTIAGATAPQIKFLSQNELAYQSGLTITTFNIQTGRPTQTIALQAANTPAQLLPSQSAIIYVNKSSIYEARTLDQNRGYIIPKSNKTWIAPISSFEKTTVAAFYSNATSAISLVIYGPKTSDQISKDFIGPIINGIRGGSSVSFLGDDDFYFVAGGQCNDAAKYINLYQSSRNQSKIIYKFTLDNCHFSSQNQLWNLQSKSLDKVSYHLLTLVPSDQEPFVHSSQLISNASGKYSSVAHFETERLIGVQMTSSNIIYTADNILCRVLQHNIDNHQHQHFTTAFSSKPLSVQVLDDKKIVLAVTKIGQSQYYSANIYSIDDSNKLSLSQGFNSNQDFLKAELYQDNYVVVYPASRKLIFFKRQPQDIIEASVNSVFDISISENYIYVAYSNGNQNILAAFQIVDDKLILVGQMNIITSIKSIKVLEGDNIILIPQKQDEKMQTYAFSRMQKFTIISSLVKNNTIHSSFAFAGEIIMFTSKSGDSTLFYDYKFVPITLSFNLPPNSCYSIIDYQKGQFLLAVGDDINHFVSLQYYKISNRTITYSGTFPYLDDGKVDASKTLLFTSRRALHVQFQSLLGQQWSTYFDLDNSPLKSYGYFYDSDSQCSDYSKASFSINDKSKQILLLYNSVDQNRLERWAIEGSVLVKKQSVPLNNFKSTNLDIKIASKGSLVLVNGISSVDAGRNYAVQVRNTKSLSQVLSYQIISNSSNSQSFESADIVNNMFVSSYSFVNNGQLDFGISFKSISQSPLPVNNQLFTSITLIATCQNCSLIAFTGQLTTPQANSQIIIQDYTDPSSYQQVSANCKVNLLAISPAGKSLSWNCENNKLYVYDISKKTTTDINTKIVYQKAEDLLMISQTRIIVSLDGKINNIDLTVKNDPKLSMVEPNAFGSAYAVNLKQSIYAVAIDASTIQLLSFSNQTIDTVKINNSIPISSMSFNQNGDLYISNNQGFIVVLTQAGCPKDQQLVNSNCQCKPLFKPGSTGCICPFSYDSQGGNCNCDDGQYFDEVDQCLDCSFLCSTCSDGEGFSCDEFSAWFYVFIILLVLIVAGTALFIGLKLRKKKRLPSLMTEERPAPTEPFVSEREIEDQQGTKAKI